MKRYNQFINRYFNFNKYGKGDFMKSYTLGDNYKFIITNSYSMIRINWNFQDKTSYKRYNDLEISKLNNKELQKSIISMFDRFDNHGYCQNVELKDLDNENYYLDENKDIYTYDKAMIKNIVNIISKNNQYSVFINDEKQAICITGNYGYAYLLPKRVF